MVVYLFKHLSLKCYVDPPWDGGMEVCSNDPNDLMTTMPRYAKKSKKTSFSFELIG